jgi:hypothetical protein
MIRHTKYFQNLEVLSNKIYSYKTEVATIDHLNELVEVPRYYSRTTSKHINYICNLLGYQINKHY